MVTMACHNCIVRLNKLNEIKERVESLMVVLDKVASPWTKMLLGMIYGACTTSRDTCGNELEPEPEIANVGKGEN